jgi:hypothetical protein
MNSPIATSIGGFLDFELALTGHNTLPWIDAAQGFHTARGALSVFLRHHKYRSVWLPVFTCSELTGYLTRNFTNLQFYALDENWLPQVKPKPNELLIFPNYFGVCSKQCDYLISTIPSERLLIDCAQACYYFRPSANLLYSPRKFFALPDGGYLVTANKLLELDACSKTSNALGIENLFPHVMRSAGLLDEAYGLFQKKESNLSDQAEHRVSDISLGLLKKTPSAAAAERRRSNFRLLSKGLVKLGLQPLQKINDDVPLVLPVKMKRAAEARRFLITQKIFCPHYWPDALQSENLLFLPIDQRYGAKEMMRIASELTNFEKKRVPT